MESSRDEGERIGPVAGEREERGGLARAEGDFVALLARAGLHAALGFLNGRVRYRYTGVYRFDPPVLRNVVLYDRENPTLSLTGGELVLRDSYCGLVQMTARPFVTEDARTDERLRDYGAREWMVSYVGVPLRPRGGGLFGTLCHWDGRPRLAPEGELELLQRLAPVLASWLVHAGRADWRADWRAD